ncbi:MAG: SPOR domain-containing protein [Balneolaceae bacterium]
MIKQFYFIFVLVLILSCSSSEPISNTIPVDESSSEQTVTTTQTAATNTTSSGIDLEKYRSSLSDTYLNKSNEVPEAYNRLKIVTEEEKDLFEGYRVQIYSGQNVAIADTIASRFRAWSDTTIVGYQAETYTFFKTPYYRVHVGDFHDRSKAIYFSNILKRQFRESWVVYDRVDPYRVPADTVDIFTK